MQTKGSMLCQEQYHRWVSALDASGIQQFASMPVDAQRLALEIWQQAWSVAVEQSARCQEARSSSRHGWDKHGDSDSLLRELGLVAVPDEVEEY
jgi:hypothetical protein